METAELQLQLAVERKAVEQNLRRLLNGEKGIPVRLKSAMRHSLMGGGKRLRPILTIWTWSAFVQGRNNRGSVPGNVMDVACALEMLHT
jgi:geranylgeranyl diphosphate synthase type II